MKRLFLTGLLILGVHATPLPDGNIAPAAEAQMSYTHGCRAQNNAYQSWGEGYAYNFSAACQIALNECAMRTPSNGVCVVVNRFYL